MCVGTHNTSANAELARKISASGSGSGTDGGGDGGEWKVKNLKGHKLINH